MQMGGINRGCGLSANMVLARGGEKKRKARSEKE